MAYDEDLDDDSPSSGFQEVRRRYSSRRKGSGRRNMKRERPETQQDIVQEMLASSAPVMAGQIFAVQPGNNGRHLEETIEQAIWKSAGRLSIAAGWLGITRRQLKERISDSERLQEVIEDIDEMRVDVAETQLDGLVLAGSDKAVMFLLKTKGKGRGYAETKQQPNGNTLTMDAARELESKLMGAVGGLREALVTQMKSSAVDAVALPARESEATVIEGVAVEQVDAEEMPSVAFDD